MLSFTFTAETQPHTHMRGHTRTHTHSRPWAAARRPHTTVVDLNMWMEGCKSTAGRFTTHSRANTHTAGHGSGGGGAVGWWWLGGGESTEAVWWEPSLIQMSFKGAVQRFVLCSWLWQIQDPCWRRRVSRRDQRPDLSRMFDLLLEKEKKIFKWLFHATVY